MRRCGRRKMINDKHHTLKDMILIVEGNGGIRHGGKAKFHNIAMFSFGNPILLRGVWTRYLIKNLRKEACKRLEFCSSIRLNNFNA
jgi:hypothetical protein